MPVDGDDDLDRLRDVDRPPRVAAVPTRVASHVARRGVPATRPAHTMTTTVPDSLTGVTGAVYDRGYRPYEGPRGGRGAATFALYRASIRRALGIRRSWRQKVAPFMLLAIVTVPAIVNVGIAYVTRDQIVPTASDHHVSRIRRRLECAARVRCHHRARHPLSRPATACAAAALRPSVDRARLRAREGGRALHDLVRVLVPAPGGAVRRTGARERQRTRLHDSTMPMCLWKVPVAVALLAAFYSVLGARSRRSRAGGSSPAPASSASSWCRRSPQGSSPGTSKTTGDRLAAALINVLGTAAVLARPRVPRPHRSGVAVEGRRERRAVRGPRLRLGLAVGIAVLLRRYRWTER